MRLHFLLSPNRGSVPFDYPHFLTGAFHRWLGPNAGHDQLSLYSLGWLQGGHRRGDGLNFPRGASWFISAPDTENGQALLHQIADAALKEPSVCCGMEVAQIESQHTPEFGARRVFRADSPVFIRGDKVGELDPHILYDDPRAADYLTRTLRHKLDKAGLGEQAATARMSFDSSFAHPKTRLIHVKENFYKKASVCPIVVEGGEEVTRFAWNVGAGNLTGSGFGSLV